VLIQNNKKMLCAMSNEKIDQLLKDLK